MNFLSDFFPFPRYLQISAAGIDVSDRSIKYAEIKKKNKDFNLKKFGGKKMDEGVIEKGLIKNKENLIQRLKSVRAELGNPYVIASLPEEKAFLKVVSLPLMKDSEIRKSLEAQIEEIVPFSSSDIIFDFEVVDGRSSKNTLEVVLSAFPKKMAEDYALVLEQAGFTPLAFEIESQSIFRALVGSAYREAVMIIDFGKTRTSFLVGEKGIVRFSSTVSVGGEHIDKALAKNLQLDIFEAERLKRTQAIQKKRTTEILNSVLPVISVIKDEAKRIFDYWCEYSKIENVILCGGDSNMVGLTDYLSYELKLSVQIGNPWSNMSSFNNYIPEIQRRDSLMYVTALGLALRSYA